MGLSLLITKGFYYMLFLLLIGLFFILVVGLVTTIGLTALCLFKFIHRAYNKTFNKIIGRRV